MTLMIANPHVVCQGMTLKMHAAGFWLMSISNVYDSDAAIPKSSHVNRFAAMLVAKCPAVGVLERNLVLRLQKVKNTWNHLIGRAYPLRQDTIRQPPGGRCGDAAIFYEDSYDQPDLTPDSEPF
jgi:hypothetical protein